MPSVKPNESQSDYVERCIPIVLHEGTAKDGAQAAAICHSMWREHHDKKSTKSSILANRSADTSLVTADQFMKSLQLCLGGDGAACGLISRDWDTQLKDAAERLTYTNVDEHWIKSSGGMLSPGSILDFEAIVTTTRKDRDGDILETSGAELDPRCALLMFHDANLPIGKLLGKTDHSKARMAARFAILNTPLGQDAKTLVEGGALRISHGFEPTEFEPLEGVKGGRWHILKYTIMEVSLVSVPSNTDAVIIAFDKGKLHHPLIKGWAKSYYDARPVQGKGMDLDVATEEKESSCTCHKKEEIEMDGKATGESPFSGQGAQQEESEDREQFGNQDLMQGDPEFTSNENKPSTQNQTVLDGPGKTGIDVQTQTATDSHGATVVDGPGVTHRDANGEVSNVGKSADNVPDRQNKAGRAISDKNRARLEEAQGHLEYVIGMSPNHASSQCKALCKMAYTCVKDTLSEPEEMKDIGESVGFDLDPNQYDVGKAAAMLMFRSHELDPLVAAQLVSELQKHVELAAWETAAEAVGVKM